MPYNIQTNVKTIKKTGLKKMLIKWISQEYEDLIVVGNPPYKLSVKFINK